MDLMLPMNTTLAQNLTLAYTWNPMLTNILVGVFLIISGAMILLVLIQRPQGGGLSGAFGAGGGGGAGQTAFGTKTGDVLTTATISIFVLFLISAIVLNFATRPSDGARTVPTATAPEGAQTESAPAETDTSTEDATTSEETAPVQDDAAIDETQQPETTTEPSEENTPPTGDE